MCHGAISGHVRGLLLILWLHIQYVSTDCTASNLVGYCRAVHCIQGSVFVPCVHTRQKRENRKGRVRSRVVGKGGSATFSARLRLVEMDIRRGLKVRQWGTYPRPAHSAHCSVLSEREGLKSVCAPHSQQPKTVKHYNIINCPTL